jgi:large subunit ribosomal protein L10
MAISKEKKAQLVGEYQRLLERSQGLVLTSYSGLTMKELEGLRRRLREVGGEFHIVKNSLIDRAASQQGLKLPAEALRGTTAVGFAGEDVPQVIKAIVELSRETEALRLKAGVIQGELFSAAQVERLADLPPLPVLRAQLLGVLAAPGSRVVGALAGGVRQLMNVLKAHSESEAAPVAG